MQVSNRHPVDTDLLFLARRDSRSTNAAFSYNCKYTINSTYKRRRSYYTIRCRPRYILASDAFPCNAVAVVTIARKTKRPKLAKKQYAQQILPY